MSGWRLGFAVSSAKTIEMLGKLTNTALSCVPPFTQLAGAAAMREACDERDRQMSEFGRKVKRLVEELNQVEGISCLMPAEVFTRFRPSRAICNRLSITSHGLAMYLLEGADDSRGVACLGGECFGEAGAGFLRLSCAEPDHRLSEAVSFIATAIAQSSRVESYLAGHASLSAGDRLPSRLNPYTPSAFRIVRPAAISSGKLLNSRSSLRRYAGNILLAENFHERETTRSRSKRPC
jgi:aspartate aminotransferase